MSGNRAETLQLVFGAGRSTPREVRQAFTRRFASHPCHEELLLCLSEVVTNAVLHAGTGGSVTVSEVGDVVRVEVADGSPIRPVRRRFSTTSPTGRGLYLVDKVAKRWGIDVVPRGGGKVVWFEIGPEGA